MHKHHNEQMYTSHGIDEGVNACFLPTNRVMMYPTVLWIIAANSGDLLACPYSGPSFPGYE
jgi:hypothetical protein